MTDDEIMDEFVRAENHLLKVGSISWPHPSTPEMKWVTVRELQQDLTSKEILEARKQIMSDKRYFARCGICDELNPLGWMHDSKICQGCAERDSGIVC